MKTLLLHPHRCLFPSSTPLWYVGMDFNKQVQRMIAFIDQEGDEKMVEIESKTEEEVNSASGNMINMERIKVNNYYTKLEDIVDKQRIVQVSVLANNARMSVLEVKERRIEALFGEIYFKLKEDLNNITFYKDIFTKLVLQALCRMMEKNVGIRIRKKDKKIIKEVIPKIVDRFQEMSKIRVRFEVDGRVFLDDDALGGIVMYSQGGNVKLENTIRSRLGLIRDSVSSFIRYKLFGLNTHRKFWD